MAANSKKKKLWFYFLLFAMFPKKNSKLKEMKENFGIIFIFYFLKYS